MNIDSGTAIVLVYVLVSMGVITASLVAALATGWSPIGCASAAAGKRCLAARTPRGAGTDQVLPS